MASNENRIEDAVEEGLKAPAFDLAVEYAELGLDAFMNNEAIKEIPIVKTLVGVVKGGFAIREIFLAKKIITFLKEFHSGKLEDEKRQAFLQELHKNQKFKELVVEQVTVLNDRFIHVEKAKILANLLKAHINEKFSWGDFCGLSECLDNLHTSGFKVLEDGSKMGFHFNSYDGNDGGGVLFSAGICIIHGNHYSINWWGQALYHYGIKGDIDFSFPNQDGLQ